ncbi:hypothetical protein [Pseudomonas viridiflava]|uniref:hypothetical protein n=1 Tax=Pseudomonas viridiflava TaxID=33069 RepID=UPI000F05C878|nr:hypothetical protein [Pseudomonas viridiflava]
MTTQHNPNVLAKQGNAEDIKAQIREFLVGQLSEWGIDPDEAFINGMGTSVGERMVIFSRSISEDAWHRIYENDQVEYADGPDSGLFSVQYSFADEHRIAEPSLDKVAELINQLVADFG